MITLDENCGVSYDLIYLLEEATSVSQFNTVEDFIVDTALKEAGKVLARAGDSKPDQSIENQLDMFEDEE